MTLSPDSSSLIAAVEKARGLPAFLEALRDVIEAAEEKMEAGGFIASTCKGCGTCCDFAAAGHRLYVTPGELAMLLEAGAPGQVEPMKCPFHVEGKCTRRKGRSLGCRLYFCDPAAEAAFQDIYEDAHRKIVRLHKAYGVEYFYGELTKGLKAWSEKAL